MNIKLARRAISLYNYDLAPKHINRHNQRSWLRMVALLGDKWLLAKPLRREDFL
jgi:hypothetical protein